MVIGVANAGGSMSPEIVADTIAALDAGLNVVAGLHRNCARIRTSSLPPNATAACCLMRATPCRAFRSATAARGRAGGCLPWDRTARSARCTPRWRSNAALRQRGLAADFRATGQTGIFIAGGGVPIDSVIADFISGATEQLSPARLDGGWDLIEGQGSLFHPSYAGVSLGLLHGAQPDALVLCHEPTRQHMRGLADYPLPDLKLCLQANLAAARLTNPSVKAVGVALNTSGLSRPAAAEACRRDQRSARAALPGPGHHGVDAIVDNLLTCLRELSVAHRSFPLRAPFRISRGVKRAADVVTVELRQSGKSGRGESVPYGRYGESVTSVMSEMEALRGQLAAGMGRDELQAQLPPGAASNALDAALWDLEAQLSGVPVWAQLARPRPAPLASALTIGIDTPTRMGEAARAFRAPNCIKIKVDADDPAARIEAVRRAAPLARISSSTRTRAGTSTSCAPCSPY